MTEVAKPYGWRLNALAWLWWVGAVKPEAVPSAPTHADLEKARVALRRLLGSLLTELKLSRPTLDRWFGSASAAPTKEPDAAFPDRAALEEALATGVVAQAAEGVDADLQSMSTETGAVFGAVGVGHPAWPRVRVAILALAEPARTRELLALAPELEHLLGRTEAASDADNWEEVFEVVKRLATRGQTGEVEVRVLGLTMNKAWRPFTSSLMQRVRGDLGDVPVMLDLFQLDPDWPGTALIHPGYPSSAEEARDRIRREVSSVIERWAPLRVRLRAYRCFIGLTGVAVFDSAIVGVVGSERDVRLNGRAYSTVRRGATGADGLLHRQFEACWAGAERESVLVLDERRP